MDNSRWKKTRKDPEEPIRSSRQTSLKEFAGFSSSVDGSNVNSFRASSRERQPFDQKPKNKPSYAAQQQERRNFSRAPVKLAFPWNEESWEATAWKWTLAPLANERQLQLLLSECISDRMKARNTEGKYDFKYLCSALQDERLFSEEERRLFLTEIVPWMGSMVSSGKRIFRSRRKQLYILGQHYSGNLTLSFEESVVLMCCCFFSLFSAHSQENSSRMGSCNFANLFCYARPGRSDAHKSKIRCILQFFFAAFYARDNLSAQSSLTIGRVYYDERDCTNLLEKRVPFSAFQLIADGLIEDDIDAVQADFANKVIGGGVLGNGCVQEEIRFVISPQLILSRLLCENLANREAVFITGSGQYSEYSGYGSSFRFERAMLIPKYVHGNTCVVAMDATDFKSNESSQYQQFFVMRELQKALVAFNGAPTQYDYIATGNWGCGAFSGDVELKLMLQWISASHAEKGIRYYVFDRKELLTTFPRVRERIEKGQISTAKVLECIVNYESSRKNARYGSLFEYLLTFPFH